MPGERDKAPRLMLFDCPRPCPLSRHLGTLASSAGPPGITKTNPGRAIVRVVGGVLLAQVGSSMLRTTFSRLTRKTNKNNKKTSATEKTREHSSWTRHDRGPARLGPCSPTVRARAASTVRECLRILNGPLVRSFGGEKRAIEEAEKKRWKGEARTVTILHLDKFAFESYMRRSLMDPLAFSPAKSHSPSNWSALAITSATFTCKAIDEHAQNINAQP